MALVKALIINLETGLPIPVMFNPEEYSISRTANYKGAKIPGLEDDIFEFINGGQETLSMDLFFDTYDSGIDVRILTARIANLLGELDTKTDSPPKCLFAWGTLTFQCVLKSLTQKFTMFSSLGLPVRATLSCTFLGYNTIDQLLAKNPFRSLGHSKTYVVKEGDTLSSIAWEVFQNAANWRFIADHNKIDNPRELVPGQILLIPAV